MSQITGQQQPNNELEVLSFGETLLEQTLASLRPGCATSSLRPHLMMIWWVAKS